MNPASGHRHEPEENEPAVEHATGGVAGFIEKSVAEVTGADVDEHLDKVLSQLEPELLGRHGRLASNPSRSIMSPPSRWQFFRASLAHRRGQLRTLWYHITGRCSGCARRRQHKMGCSRRPGKGVPFSASLHR